jgi:F-type H+-transporting ATPase subunit b
MNINLTLIGQSIAFAVFVWFCMKFIWPPLLSVLNERKTKIADGLAAAERGHHEKELAEKRAKEVLREGKEQVKEILAQAHKRADEIVDEAKQNAKSEGERIIVGARAEIDQEMNQARENLRGEVVSIALAAAEQVLEREVDSAAHNEVLQKFAAQL